MALDELDRRILDVVQAEFPLEARPFRALAEQVGSTEEEVLERIRKLQERGVIRQIGPVFDLKRLGHTSTLCAAKVSPEAVERVASFVNRFDEVTHNYLRDHEFNMWFTVIAPSKDRIEAILERVRAEEGVVEAVSLPAERTFKINVHFPSTGGNR